MIDDNGLRAALGLGAFPGIIDDEWIEMGHRTERHFREACLGQRQGLARQPFEITVFAQVDHRMGGEVLSQPGIEGEIAVRRHQLWVVIARRRIDVVAARRLQAQCYVAETMGGQKKSVAVHEGIRFRVAPAFRHCRLHAVRQGAEEYQIVR